MISVAEHIRYCETDGCTILLDIRSGRYRQLPARLALALERVGVPTGDIHRDVEAEDRLIDLGYCSEDEQSPPSRLIPAPVVDSFDNLNGRVRRSGRNVILALGLIVAARIIVRWLSFQRMIGLIDKLTATRKGDQAGMPVAEAAHFERARSFIRARHKCLPDAIALHLLLRWKGFPSLLVLGVRVAPFEAHAWVQSRRTVIGDLHERVTAFTPIMSVGNAA